MYLLLMRCFPREKKVCTRVHTHTHIRYLHTYIHTHSYVR